jgi:streptogramin lyase
MLTALLLSLPAKAPAQTITEYSIPSKSSLPFAVAPGPDGALWFTEAHANH